jgi:hypothetical protein
MHDRRDEHIADVQTFVLAGSFVGLAFVTIPLVITVSRFTDESAGRNLRSALFLVAIGWPFMLGLITRWWPKDIRRRRWVWLLCFIGVPVPAYYVMSLGFFLVPTALVYPWAFWMTRPSMLRA